MADVTVTTAAGALATRVSDRTLPAFEAALVLRNLVTVEMQPVGKGDVIKFPPIGALAATARSAGADVTFLANTDTAVTMTINKEDYVALNIEGIVKLLASPSYLAGLALKMGLGLAVKIQSRLVALNTSLTEAVGTSTTKITLAYSHLVDAKEDVDGNNVPEEGRFWLFNSVGVSKVLNLTQIIKSNYAGVAELALGGGLAKPFARILGYPAFQTSATPANKIILAGQDAFGLGLSSELITMLNPNDVRKQGDLMSVAAIYGTKSLRPGSGSVIHYNT